MAAKKPGKKARTRMSPEDRREQLLQAALTVFAQKGLARSGHADVAKITGVSVPTVFNYFPTRDALLDAVLTEVETFFLGIARDVYDNCDDPFEALLQHGRTFLEAAEEHEDYIHIWLEWSTTIGKDTWLRFVAFQDQLVEIASQAVDLAQKEGRIPAGWSCHDFSYFFISCAQMVVTRLYTPNQTQGDVEQFIARILTMVVQG